MDNEAIEKEKKRQRIKNANHAYVQRFTVIQFLGGMCTRCGEDDIVCLQLDHIEPVLRSGERINRAGNYTVRDIWNDRLDTSDMQVLCANCHAKKTYEDRQKFSRYIGD